MLYQVIESDWVKRCVSVERTCVRSVENSLFKTFLISLSPVVIGKEFECILIESTPFDNLLTDGYVISFTFPFGNFSFCVK